MSYQSACVVHKSNMAYWIGLQKALQQWGVTDLRPEAAVDVCLWDVCRDGVVKTGDHVAVRAEGDVCWHHGVCCEDGQVADNCKKGGLKKRTLVDFIASHKAVQFARVQYDGDDDMARLETAARANACVAYQMDNHEEFCKYHLVNFNCEAFATMCRTGRYDHDFTRCESFLHKVHTDSASHLGCKF